MVSYGDVLTDRAIVTSAHLDQRIYERRLEAIGHLYDAAHAPAPVMENEQPVRAAAPLSPQQWGRYAWENNLGVQLRAQKKYSDAVDALQQAIQLNPTRPTPWLNLAITLFDWQHYTDANDAFVQAVTRGLPDAENEFVDFAALYRQQNMVSRGIQLLQKGEELFPQSYLIAANLGSALVDAGRYTEGVPELERALGLRPSSTEVLNNLGIFYAKKQDLGRALDYWNRSLSIEPHQPQIRQAADAARSRL